MRVRRGIRWAAGAGVVAVALAACSSGGEEKAPEDRVTIGSLLGQPSYDDVDWNAQQRAIEEAVAACMREEGWEYIPVEYPDMNSGDMEYNDEDEVARIKREGFGIVYWTLNQDADNPGFTDGPGEWTDPNQDYVDSLSESEREAYYASLYGSQEEQEAMSTTEIDPETGDEVTYMSGMGAGCQGEAYTEIQGDDPTQNPEYWDAVQPYYDELQERLQADPRIVELTDKWSACMKDKNYDYKNQDDFYSTVYDTFYQRQEEVLGPDYYQDPTEGWTEDQINEFFSTATQEQIDELYKQPELSAEQRAGLEEILADEIDMALAEHECSKDLNEKAADIYPKIEEEYALEHEDELRALAASLGADS